MFKHNWAWIKLATDNFSTVLTRNLRNPRDYAPLITYQKSQKIPKDEVAIKWDLLRGSQILLQAWERG